MITYDITKAQHFTSKADGEQAFVSWCTSIQINPEQFPFKVETFKYTRKGQNIIYRVVSWGCYISSDDRWIVFLSYRCAANGACIQYNWFCDDNGMPIDNPQKHEFLS